MKRLVWSLAGLLCCVGPILAQPAVTAVVNAASFEPGVARGSLVSIFGTGLARSTISASSLPLPTRLEDTVVRVGAVELEAPLYFVSPTQINAQFPFEVLGDRLAVVVTTAAGRSAPFLLTLAASGAGIFTRTANGKGRALVFGPNFEPVDAVTPGEPIVFYAAGLGFTNPPALSGIPGAAAEPFNRAVTVPEVFVGDVPAQVVFAGLAPGFAGVYQINVVPQGAGTDRLFLRSRGKLSNITEVGLRPGQSVTNASGTIQALFPTAEPPPGFQGWTVGWSPHLLVARFTARMDIAPAAGPFAIVAVTDGTPSAVITVDPGNGSFEGVVTLPTMRSRAGDFSATDLAPISDLFSCHRGPTGEMISQPFPNAIIPASRLHPLEVQAVNRLPLPDTAVEGSAIGLLRVRGEVRPGSTFVIDEQNNSQLSVFAGYIPLRTLCAPNQTTTLKLFIDGRLVASTELRYTAPGFAPPDF